MSQPPEFPESISYWHLIRSTEQACEVATRAQELVSGEVASRLGTVMSLLYRMACCHWGCHEKEHVFEYLAGRTCSSAHSAFRLIGFGYYDESLSLTRNIAEIGNLANLFFTDHSHIRLWLDLPDKERRRAYGPASVRTKLTSLGAVVPTEQDSYSWLCEVGTHVTPRTRPQSHNAEMRPTLGAVLQSEGLKMSLEALAWSVCTVSAPLAKLAILERANAERLFEESIALINVL